MANIGLFWQIVKLFSNFLISFIISSDSLESFILIYSKLLSPLNAESDSAASILRPDISIVFNLLHCENIDFIFSIDLFVICDKLADSKLIHLRQKDSKLFTRDNLK